MMIVALLIKFIFMIRVHMKQIINILFKNVKKMKKNGIENSKDSKPFTEYLNNMGSVYKNLED